MAAYPREATGKMRSILIMAAAAAMVVGAAPAPAKELGYGVLVGRVTNTSSRMNRKLFVQAGSEKWALHLNRTSRIYHDGVEVSVHDIDVSSWVKARGRRIGDLRLEVSRLDIAGDRAAYRKSDAYRKAKPDGYYIPK